MKKYNILTLKELSEKAKNDLNWYWDAVNEDLGIVWHQKYTKISDFSEGKPWPKTETYTQTDTQSHTH